MTRGIEKFKCPEICISLISDLALLRLPTPIETPFHKYEGSNKVDIQIIPINDKIRSPRLVGKYLRVMGWGRMEEMMQPEILRTTKLKIIPGKEEDHIGKKLLVLSQEDGKGSCYGDSGGMMSTIKT